MRPIAPLLLSTFLSASCLIERRTLESSDAREPDALDASLDAEGLHDVVAFDTHAEDAFAEDAFAEDAHDALDAYAPPDATADAFMPDAFVCSGFLVYGQCVSGLRLWLNATDLSAVGEGGEVSRWVNRATTSPTRDATQPGGEGRVSYTAAGGGAVVFGAGRFRTEGPISVDGAAHFEVFVAATSRATANGYLFETDGATTPRLSAHLPWTDAGETRAYFDIPWIAGARMQTPFAPLAVWHAYRGTSGSGLFVNGTAVVTTGALPASGRNSNQRLWLGGADPAYAISSTFTSSSCSTSPSRRKRAPRFDARCGNDGSHPSIERGPLALLDDCSPRVIESTGCPSPTIPLV